MSEAALQRDDDGLGPIGDVEPLKDDADVRLHGRFLNEELLGDLAVAVTAYKEGEHLALAGAKVTVRLAGGECGRDGGWDETSACVDAPYCIEEAAVRHALDEIAHGAGFEGLVNVPVALVGGKDDDMCARGGGNDAPDRLDSADIGQRKIHQGDVGVVLVKEPDSLECSACLRDDGHVRTALNNGDDAKAQNGVVVDHEDADGCGNIRRKAIVGARCDCHRGTIRPEGGCWRCWRSTVARTMVPFPVSLVSMKAPPIR